MKIKSSRKRVESESSGLRAVRQLDKSDVRNYFRQLDHGDCMSRAVSHIVALLLCMVVSDSIRKRCSAL
jgi:hypothetical protein